MAQRQRASELIEYVKQGQTWEELATQIGCSPVWLCSAFLGDSSLSEDIWKKLVDLAKVKSETEKDNPTAGHNVVAACAAGEVGHSACQPQQKAKENWKTLQQDPTLYRMHEINLVYGRAIREVIREKFGDGIMSAVDLKISVDKISDPNGDRVKLTFNGKFLPYKPW